MAVWGGLTNNHEEKRSKKQRRKWKIFPFECRVPKNSKEREESCKVVMYARESWTIKKAEHRRIDAFELSCWKRLLRVPWTARRSNQSILKEISPGCPLEGMMLKLKLQYLATSCEEPTHWKRPWCRERLKARGEGDDRDEMVGWHHWLDGHEFE